jgi:uncharacterized protein YajQ (UPF0234 family)
MKTFGYVVLVILGLVALSAISFGIRSCNIARTHVTNSMENAVVSYDEYQDIYNTCLKLNEDLGVMKSTADDDIQFQQISKSQRVTNLKLTLNRWIAEYNSKSKYIDKKYWKSSELPQTLSTNQFSNY